VAVLSREDNRLNLPLQWTVANALGWTFGIVLLARASESGFNRMSYIAVGALIGAAQWLVLRRRVRHAVWWIGAAAAGWIIGLVLGVPRRFLSPDPYWTGIAGGGLAGLLQTALLWKQVRRPLLWVAASLVATLAGSIAATWTGFTVYDTLTTNVYLAYALAGLAGGLAAGAVSLPVILHFFRERST
jgi:hypothetical protein